MTLKDGGFLRVLCVLRAQRAVHHAKRAKIAKIAKVRNGGFSTRSSLRPLR